MKVLITGATGLIGSRIVEILSHQYDFAPITRAHGADITNAESLAPYVDSDAEWVLHLAGKTDVDSCEKDKTLGENGEAWRMNVIGTKNIIQMCREGKKKLIYISTDFVFDGEKPEGEGYSEEDTPNPINWYAQTKYEGEKLILSSAIDHIILRIAYPYRREFELKSDFVRTIMNRLKDKIEVKAVTDHIMCPTFIDDLAIVLDKLLKQNVHGIYHSVGATPISPFDAAHVIAKTFSLNSDLIKPTTRSEFFAGRAMRPFNLYLKNAKMENLGVEMTLFQKGLESLR